MVTFKFPEINKKFRVIRNGFLILDLYGFLEAEFKLWRLLEMEINCSCRFEIY